MNSSNQLAVDHMSVVDKQVALVLRHLPAKMRAGLKDDLIGAGMVGLVEAARAFDPSRGVPFAAYAALRVRGAVIDEQRRNDRLSRPTRTSSNEVERVRRDMANANGGVSPTSIQIAEALGIPVERVESLATQADRGVPMSLDAINDLSPAAPHARETEPEPALLARERVSALHEAVNELPDRLHAVVHAYYFAGQKEREIGARLGVHGSRVNQLKVEARKELARNTRLVAVH